MNPIWGEGFKSWGWVVGKEAEDTDNFKEISCGKGKVIEESGSFDESQYHINRNR